MSLLTFIKILSLHFILGGTPAPSAEDRYIQNYKDIAIAEMHRSGIPASIKLAQGLLESQAGKSPLAVKANNHFGIKCKKTWLGPTYYKKDDDRDHKGKLLESCFRAYDFDHQSYIDHTNFLLHRERYKDLFSYGRQDYVNWAIGLKRCGYATDRKYAQKLIKTIENYNLAQYDLEEAPTFSKSVKVTMPVYELPENYRPGDGHKTPVVPVKKSAVKDSASVAQGGW